MLNGSLNIKYLLFTSFGITAFAQNIVFGNVFSVSGFVLQTTVVINVMTGIKALTNNEGNFIVFIISIPISE